MALNTQHQGCPRCGHKLALDQLRWDTPTPCPACRTALRGEAFPALLRPLLRGQRADAVMDEREAACFFHEDNRAVNACATCGRFVCSLCALELPSGVACPSCFNDGGLAASSSPVLEKSRRIWSSLASVMLLLSALVFWPSTLVTAPVAGGMAIYGMRRPGSLTGRGRWKNVAVLILALIVMGLWAWGLTNSKIWQWLAN